MLLECPEMHVGKTQRFWKNVLQTDESHHLFVHRNKDEASKKEHSVAAAKHGASGEECCESEHCTMRSQIIKDPVSRPPTGFNDLQTTYKNMKNG